MNAARIEKTIQMWPNIVLTEIDSESIYGSN